MPVVVFGVEEAPVRGEVLIFEKGKAVVRVWVPVGFVQVAIPIPELELSGTRRGDFLRREGCRLLFGFVHDPVAVQISFQHNVFLHLLQGWPQCFNVVGDFLQVLIRLRSAETIALGAETETASRRTGEAPLLLLGFGFGH